MKRLFCPYAKKDREAVHALWSFPQIQFPTHTLPFTRACITAGICKQRFRLSSQSQRQFANVTKLPTKASDRHTTSSLQYALLHVLGSPHTCSFSFSGDLSVSQAQRRVHQCCCCRYISTMHVRKAPSLSFDFDLYYFFISQSFDKTRSIWKPNAEDSPGARIFIYNVSCVFFSCFLLFFLLTSCYCSYDENLIPVLTFFLSQ